MFDEISNTQVLGDVNIANKAGRQLKQRFKLDSAACSNLCLLGSIPNYFSKKDRDLKASIDNRVLLIIIIVYLRLLVHGLHCYSVATCNVKLE